MEFDAIMRKTVRYKGGYVLRKGERVHVVGVTMTSRAGHRQQSPEGLG
jgi:hypothetical protein